MLKVTDFLRRHIIKAGGCLYGRMLPVLLVGTAMPKMVEPSIHTKATVSAKAAVSAMAAIHGKATVPTKATAKTSKMVII